MVLIEFIHSPGFELELDLLKLELVLKIKFEILIREQVVTRKTVRHDRVSLKLTSLQEIHW
jgi:hypothetical protein